MGKNLMGNPKNGKSATSTDTKEYESDGTLQTSDVQIILLKAPMIQYKQLTLDTNFRQYLETILFSAKVLRMGVQKTPYQKTCELQAGSQDFTVDFQGANRKFDWIEISLVYDKSDKHLIAYDSYNAECASKFIKSLEFANISDQHSSTNTLKFDIGNDLQKHVKHGVWHSGNGQTGGFFPLGAPLAGILAGPVIDNIAAPLIKGVVKKIIGRGAPPCRRRRQRHNYRIVYY